MARAANTLVKRARQVPYENDRCIRRWRSEKQEVVAESPDGSDGAVPAGCQWAVLGIFGIQACDVPITIKLEKKA